MEEWKEGCGVGVVVGGEVGGWVRGVTWCDSRGAPCNQHCPGLGGVSHYEKLITFLFSG